MGVYTSKAGIAVAAATGMGSGHVTQTSWHPSLKREEGRVVYPAEEIFDLKKNLTPDSTILYDTTCPLSPFFITLPRLKPGQVIQALMMELETRNVSLLMEPVPGFCLNCVYRNSGRDIGLAGFGLVADGNRIREVLARHRPLGIHPNVVTLPIIPLAFYSMEKITLQRYLLFLMSGSQIMIAGIETGKLSFLEVFYGNEGDLASRLETHLQGENGIQDIFGFEIHAPSKQRPATAWRTDVVFTPLPPGETVYDRVCKRNGLSTEAVAGLLARLPWILGTSVYGGIHVTTGHANAGEKRAWLRNTVIAAGLTVLGLSAMLGLRAFYTRSAYLQQKRHIKRELKTVLPGLPSVVSLSLLKSKLAEARKVRGHLDAFFAPSTLALPEKILPLLDNLEGARIVEIQAAPESITIIFECSAVLDAEKIKKSVMRPAGSVLAEFVKHKITEREKRRLYTLKVAIPQPGAGKARAK